MSKRSLLLVVCLMGFLSSFVSDFALARGILGPQPGDRSPEENEHWLKTAVEHLQMGIKEANQGNAELSVENGKASMAALKEISSEGWDGTRERSVKSMRAGISAAKKGNLEKASLDFQDALEKLGDLKYGDMNFTHETFLGIGDHK